MDEDLELTDVSVKQKSKLSRLRRAVLPVAASPSKSPSHKQDANSPAQQSTADQDGLGGSPEGLSELAKATSHQASPADSGEEADSGGEEDEQSDGGDADESRQFYNEEDELLEYIKRNKQSAQSRSEPSAASPTSSHNASGSDEEGHEAAAAESGQQKEAEESADEDVNVSTQRLLRETAAGDRIGKGPMPAAKPMDGMLAALRARIEANKARAAKTSGRSLPVDPEKRREYLQGNIGAKAADSSATGPEGSAPKALKSELTAAAMQVMLADLPTIDEEATLIVEDDLVGEATAVDSKEDPAADDATKSSPAVDDMQREQADEAADSEDEKHSRGSESGANDESGLSDEGLEEDASGSSSGESSSSSSDDDSSEADSPEAQGQALAEARAMLLDRQQDSRGHFFEDEAEMSEDEGHSEDAETDEDEAEHAELLGELIGHQRERKGDEKRRARLHAEWQAAQDEQDLNKVLQGVRDGFRKRADPLFGDDEGRSLEDARRRRAAAAAGPQPDASSSESDTESSAEDEEEVDVADVSDDDLKMDLLEFEMQRRAARSQAEIVENIRDEAEYREGLYTFAPAFEAAQEPQESGDRELRGDIAPSSALPPTETFMHLPAALTNSRSACHQGASRGFVWRETSQAGKEQAAGEAGSEASGPVPTLRGVKRDREPLAVHNRVGRSVFDKPRPKAATDDNEAVGDIVTKLLAKRPRPSGRS